MMDASDDATARDAAPPQVDAASMVDAARAKVDASAPEPTPDANAGEPDESEPDQDPDTESSTSAVHTDIEERHEGGCACSAHARWPGANELVPVTLFAFASLLTRHRRRRA
jgi:hypothetical protein